VVSDVTERINPNADELPERDRILAAGPAPIKTIRFSTESFSESKRVGAYREIYSRTIVKHDIEPLGDQPFRFEADLLGLPGLGLASSYVSPCRRWHTTDHIDSDDFLFGIALSGGCVLRQRGREAVIEQRGEAVLASAAHPVDVIIGTNSRHISLRLPRAILETRIVDLDACNARRIPSNTESLSLLVSYVDALCVAELTDTAFCDLAVSHIYDLITLILGARGDTRYLAQEGGARAARLAAILREIKQRSGDPRLSAITIALQLGITPRYVHRLLEETGKSFTQHVLQQRLESAAALLRDPQRRHRKIAEIAAEAGFSDLSYFNRAFRRHFDATPSDVLNASNRAARRQ
jgi:AraC-like DNA-binding protein